MPIEGTRPTVILGRSAASVSGDAPREPASATFAEIDALLASAPRAAIVADTGLGCFFRASLAGGRGAARVLVRQDSLEPSMLGELAARARELGAELSIRGSGGAQSIVRPGPRVQVGAATPVTHDAATPDGAVHSPASTERATDLDDDDPLGSGVPAEEIAFDIGLKPVLYLVVSPAELAAARARHPDAHVVSAVDRVSIDSASGARSYGEGVEIVHAFLAADARDAERAADAWRDGSSRNVGVLGSLMGYPTCCTRAFAALPSRRDNAALVHVTAARTRALGASFTPALNVAVHRWVPFTPCVFSCAAAVRWSERVLSTLAPEALRATMRALSRAVYYVDEAHAVVFEDARLGGDGDLEYSMARWLPRPLASASVRAALAARFGGTHHARLGAAHDAGEPTGSAGLVRPGVLLPFGMA